MYKKTSNLMQFSWFYVFHVKEQLTVDILYTR